MTQGDEMIGDDVGCVRCLELRRAALAFRAVIVRSFRLGKVTGTWETMAEFEDALMALDEALKDDG